MPTKSTFVRECHDTGRQVLLTFGVFCGVKVPDILASGGRYCHYWLCIVDNVILRVIDHSL